MKHAKEPEGLVRRLAAAQFSVLGIVPVVNLVTIEGLPALARYFSLQQLQMLLLPSRIRPYCSCLTPSFMPVMETGALRWYTRVKWYVCW